ncbi:putative uracil phosphoribosyltransferase [Thermoascus aurantiacus ATCC 26904]
MVPVASQEPYAAPTTAPHSNDTTNGNAKSPSTKVTVLRDTPQLRCWMTTIRDARTQGPEFARAVGQVSRMLMYEALNHVPSEPVQVTTPTGGVYNGARTTMGVCGVSILRAGASLEQGLRDCWSGDLNFGKILIQRDEETALPTLMYSKFPSDIKDRFVLLLEPMLATGGSASKAIALLKEQGVPESHIVFVNVIASVYGLDVITKKFPELNIVTAAVDSDLDEKRRIMPGLGDFGDRFYGT